MAINFVKDKQKVNEDILEGNEVHPVQKKLAQYKQKWLNHGSRVEDVRYTQLLEYRPIESDC
jgi:hypothetical protein